VGADNYRMNYTSPEIPWPAVVALVLVGVICSAWFRSRPRL
jgi:hypothetical protein